MNTTPPSDVHLKTYQTPKDHTRWTPFTHNTHAPLWIPVPAWRQLLRPITVGRSCPRPGPALRGHGNTKWFQTNAPHTFANPLLTHPLVRTSPETHALIVTSGRGLVTLLGDQRYRYHTPSLSHHLSSGRVCLHSIETDVPLSHPLNITPPRYHTPSCGAPVHGAYHRGYVRYHTPL